MSNRVIAFFEKVGHEFKVIGKDIAAVITKLFGAQFLSSLETTAQQILQSDLGQAALADGEELLAQVKSGTISQETAIVRLGQSVAQAAKATGVELESSIATMVASAVFAKLSGVVSATPAAPAPSAPTAPATPSPAPAA